MKFELISTSQAVLSVESIESITITTESGEITIMPHHEPLISALKPGIMRVKYFVGNQIHSGEYVIGGGVVSISADSVVVIADFVEHSDDIPDTDYIEDQKKKAEQIMKEFHAKSENKIVDPHKLIEVEYELLKYTAMHQLAYQKEHEEKGKRG